MRIGISIMTGDKQNVWNNGLVQNIYHFAGLIQSIPFVEKVYLLNCGDRPGHPDGSDEEARRFPLVNPADVIDAMDIAIEMGGAIEMEWIRRFRFGGGKFILHLCGQPYVSLIEPTVFGREGFFLDPERFEEIWLLAKDMVFAPILRTVHRCPVHQVPYLWSPRFLEQTITRHSDGSSPFGYRAGSLRAGPACPAIFEPNLSPIKMGLIPCMICDAAEEHAPSTIDQVTFLNGEGMAHHPAYVHFMQNSTLYKAGKTGIIGRDYFSHVMARGSNMVVSHQLACPQNYLYLDALYGAYPLIHNSKIFRDVGYYYPDSDVAAGAKALLAAIRCHDQELNAYRARANEVIAALAPTARANVDHYARRILALMDAPARRSAT